MTHALRNFSSASELLAHTEAFYSKAAALLDELQPFAPLNARDALFFAHATDALRSLAALLTTYRLEHDAESAFTWVQYTPDDPLPDTVELANVLGAATRAEQLLWELVRLTECWVHVYATLASKGTGPAVTELFETCNQMLQRWSRDLSHAYNQSNDV